MDSLRRNALSVSNECSIYSKIICLGFIGFYGLSFIPSSEKYLAVGPGYLLPPNMWLWTLLTFSVFEKHIWNLIINIATVFLVEKLLLPLWKWRELMKFCLIVNFFSAILTVVTYFLVYVFTFEIEALYDTYIHGLTALFAALTVAGRQQMGENIIFALPLGNLRNKHLPFCLVSFLLVITVFRIIETTYLLLSMYGVFVSWVYLRFYQKHKTGGHGDFSDEFTFAGFFPNHLEPPVAILSNTVFSLLIRIRICKKFDRRYDLSSPTTISLNIGGVDSQDAERRKQLALKALNERLNRADSTPQWPALIDEPKEEAPAEPSQVVSEDETADASKDEATIALEMTPLIEAKEEGRSEPS